MAASSACERSASTTSGTGPARRCSPRPPPTSCMADLGPRERAVSLALSAIEGETLLEADNGLFWMAAMLALVVADNPEAGALWERVVAHGAPQRLALLEPLDEPLGRRLPARAGRAGGGGAVAAVEHRGGGGLRPRRLAGHRLHERVPRRRVPREGRHRGGSRDDRRARSSSPATPRTARTSRARASSGVHLASGNGEAALAAAEDYEQHAAADAGTRAGRRGAR